MKTPKIKPFLYEDICEIHDTTKFIVEVRFISKTHITFVFFCKKCYHQYGNDAQAWEATTTVADFTKMFGFGFTSDN